MEMILIIIIKIKNETGPLTVLLAAHNSSGTKSYIQKLAPNVPTKTLKKLLEVISKEKAIKMLFSYRTLY